MKSEDPIASATLARLYLAQGHADRARTVLAEVLRRDAFDGVALVVLRRVGPRDAAALVCEAEGGCMRIRWTRVSPSGREHVVLVTFTAEGGGELTRVTSMRCREANGTWELPLVARTGAAAACIGRLEDGAWQVLAVAPAIRWG